MSGAELRKAAETLRALADDATSGIGPASMQSAWRADHDRYSGETTITSGVFQVGQVYCIQTGEYIATMHPSVGLAIADLLNNIDGAQEQDIVAIERHAVELARLINGGAA